MFKRLLIAALILLAPTYAVAETVFIGNDNGGQVDEYVKRWKRYHDNGDLVVIDGDCVSACGRFMSLPKVCAMPGAHFYLHGITFGTHHTLDVQAGIADSRRWETPKAFLLQKKYNAFAFGRYQSVTRMSQRVEPGVSIVHIYIPSEGLWMRFLKVQATKLVRPCVTRINR